MSSLSLVSYDYFQKVLNQLIKNGNDNNETHFTKKAKEVIETIKKNIVLNKLRITIELSFY